MSRQSSAPRSLSLPEELEKLEQSITLTLQEIDSNFSRAHRIVTGSILPIVEQYAKHSNAVWDGSKFWKQFFEASANVSLSGYEEGAHDEENDTQHDTETTATLQSPTGHEEERTVTDAGAQHSDNDDDDDFSTMNSPTQVTGVQSTPRLNSNYKHQAESANKPSASREPPASAFRSPSPRKYTGKNPLGSAGPSTPHAAASSPFEPESAYQPSAQYSAYQQARNNDVLLHRGVLDKNYRVQATPHTQRRAHQQPTTTAATPGTATRNTTSTKALWEDSPTSSPEIAAPQLRSDLFSPEKQKPKPTPAPRTPGISVQQTPFSTTQRPNPPTTSTGRQLFPTTRTPLTTGGTPFTTDGPNADSDEDDSLDYEGSPPKTMQFHVPQSRLVQTPAKEASRKIVEDLLLTAGADEGSSTQGEGWFEREEGEGDDVSPSVVRGRFVEEDSF